MYDENSPLKALYNSVNNSEIPPTIDVYLKDLPQSITAVSKGVKDYSLFSLVPTDYLQEASNFNGKIKEAFIELNKQFPSIRVHEIDELEHFEKSQTPISLTPIEDLRKAFTFKPGVIHSRKKKKKSSRHRKKSEDPNNPERRKHKKKKKRHHSEAESTQELQPPKKKRKKDKKKKDGRADDGVFT